MELTITPEIVVSYSQCPRKAYLLMFSPDNGEPHEYVQILAQQRCENQERSLDRLQQTQAEVHPYALENLRNGSMVLSNARLQVDRLEAECEVLTRVEGKSTFGKHYYEPTVFVGTYSISTEQKLALSFVGYVLGRLQNKPPMAGRIIGMDGKAHSVKLDKASKDILPLLEPLQEWTTVGAPELPPLVLNKHCPLCPFQRLGYPLKAGQCRTSSPASPIALALPRSGQCGHVREHGLKEVWKLPTKKARGWRRAIKSATIKVMQHGPHLVALPG